MYFKDNNSTHFRFASPPTRVSSICERANAAGNVQNALGHLKCSSPWGLRSPVAGSSRGSAASEWHARPPPPRLPHRLHTVSVQPQCFCDLHVPKHTRSIKEKSH